MEMEGLGEPRLITLQMIYAQVPIRVLVATMYCGCTINNNQTSFALVSPDQQMITGKYCSRISIVEPRNNNKSSGVA